MGDNSCYFYRRERDVRMETLEKIKRRAYDIYEARLYWNIPGDEVSDWLQAEQEVQHANRFWYLHELEKEE